MPQKPSSATATPCCSSAARKARHSKRFLKPWEKKQSTYTRFAQKIKEAQDKIQEIREKKQEALKHDTLLPTWLEEFKQYEHIKTLERRVVVELIDHIDVHSKTEIEIHFCFEDELHSITEKFMEYQAHHGNEVAEE